MAEALDLLNAALVHLGGEEPLAALAAEGEVVSRPERLYRALIGPLLDAMLREHNWACATKRIVLPNAAAGGDWRFTRFCQLPDNYLRVWSVETSEAWEVGFAGADRGVWTNVATQLQATLTVRVPIAQLDTSLFDALALRLAARLAAPLRADAARAAKLEAAADEAMAGALAAETSEWGAEPTDDTDLLRAAMGHLGEEAPADAWGGPSMKAKRAYRALIGPLLDGVLRAHDWACATSRAVLAPEPAPAGDWRYTFAHTLPADTLRVRSVETTLAWEVGRVGARPVVLCSTAGALNAVLTRRVTAAGLDPALFSAVALMLASQMAGPLGVARERAEALAAAGQEAMGAAVAADGGEWGTDPADNTDLLRAALGFMGEEAPADAAAGGSWGGPSMRVKRAYRALVGPLVDAVLRQHDWACATSRGVLPAEAVPAGEWRYTFAHTLPAETLKVRSVETALAWEVGRVGARPVVLCSTDGALNAVLTRRVTAAGLDPALFSAVAMLLAAQMAAALGLPAERVAALQAQADAALGAAAASDTGEWAGAADGGRDLLRAVMAHLGEGAGGSAFAGPSARARRAYQSLAGPTLDGVLRSHPWACATVRAVLAPVAAPEGEWRYASAHPLPAGALRVWSVETGQRWEVGRVAGQDVVFASSPAASLAAVLIVRVAPAQLDADLFDAVALLLAARMAPSLELGATVMRQLRADAQDALQLALGAQTSEWGNEPPLLNSTWLAARDGLSGWNGEGPPPGTVSIPTPGGDSPSTLPLGAYFSAVLGATPPASTPGYDLISNLDLGAVFEAELEATP